MSEPPSQPWTQALADLQARGLHRALREIESAQSVHLHIEGRDVTSFCTNNYLGLANHPQVVAAVKDAVDRWGWGSGASRLVTGTMSPHIELERKLATFKRTEAALVCSTGYQANLAAIRALAGEGDVLFLDKLNHASIIDAARGSGAIARVFPHRDYDKLERLLDRYASAGRRVIVTDSLFSMDGDLADLPKLVELKRRYDAMLCVDEAHATGVFGDSGGGLTEAMKVEFNVDVIVGTLSKALGGLGGFIAGSRSFIDWVVNTAGAFIYTTAPPPAACAAASTAIDLVQQDPQRRQRLLAMSERLRQTIDERFPGRTGSSKSQIIPLIIGDADATMRLSRQLEEACSSRRSDRRRSRKAVPACESACPASTRTAISVISWRH